MTRAGIAGLGLWTSDVVVRNDAWPAAFVEGFHAAREARRRNDFTLIERSADARPFDALFVKHALPHDDDPFKGTTQRRVTPDDLPTATCDARALARALEDARVPASELDLILSSALVPDHLAPSNGPAIAAALGIPGVPALGVEGFCASALVQLEMATALIESGRARYVACVQSHHVGRLRDREGPTSPIFGDASTAMVVGPTIEGGVQCVVRGGDARLARGVTYVRRGGEAAAWFEAGSSIVPGTDDPEAARVIARNALAYPVETIRELADRSRLPMDAVAAVATIQPLVWYAPAVAEALGLAPERVPTTHAELAHIGGCAVVANLLAARARGLLRKDARVVLYAHGAGITRYACLVQWTGTMS